VLWAIFDVPIKFGDILPGLRARFQRVRRAQSCLWRWQPPSGWNTLRALNGALEKMTDSDRSEIHKILPFDGEGCPRTHFFEMLDRAVLCSPTGSPLPPECLCVFLFSVHQYTQSLGIFIRRLYGPEFIFVIAADEKAASLRGRLENEFVNQSNVFFLAPPVRIFWGSFSQSFPPWMTVKALWDAGVVYDWISFHSGTDVVIRSRAVVIEFFKRYRGHAEFFDTRPSDWGRIDIFNRGEPGCASRPDLDTMQNTVRGVYNRTAWNLSAQNFGLGANWATISRGLAERVLSEILSDLDFAIRVSFTGNSDEIFLQTYAKRLGVGVNGSCGTLTFFKMQICHPYPLTESLIGTARAGFYLFARKMPEYASRSLNSWIDKQIKADESDEFPAVLTPRPGLCYEP
jgi:hypothetical protein